MYTHVFEFGVGVYKNTSSKVRQFIAHFIQVNLPSVQEPFLIIHRARHLSSFCACVRRRSRVWNGGVLVCLGCGRRFWCHWIGIGEVGWTGGGVCVVCTAIHDTGATLLYFETLVM